ncbi:hypothetical protein EXU85_15695 [Spirosoma sp. KCTC 42546]|uniref:hypothetical protein n=1 Tax=Spirosoma sp. KCTC 42546 TaxID=2520506 RepID=UPI00115B987C|nr:hypothetical protein [Spirosoma sp. KCTC 42546]QDK79975.1 hypothetical protein EXU85_15695 [Spirosoma sp. KCTC 42546]
MKAKQIRFFSPNENSESKKQKKKSAAKPVPVTGYISSAGKVVFPDKTIAQLGFDPQNNLFKVGTQDGKRKIKSLYLIPGAGENEEAFELEKAAKSHSISLPYILQKGGIDFANTKHTFTVKPFDYDNGVTGYELKLAAESTGPKPEYTGKPRGRKRLNPAAE